MQFLFFFIDNFWDYLYCNMVIFGIKMTAIKFPIKWWDLFSKISRFEFLTIFVFIIFTYIFSHSDLDLWPKFTNFDRVCASAISNYLTKTAFKSVYSFGCNCVHKHKWLNDVIMTSSLIWFLWNLNTNRRRIYISDIPIFISINHKRT